MVGTYQIKAPPEILEATGIVLEISWTDQKVVFGSKLGDIPLAATGPTKLTGPNGMKFLIVVSKDGKTEGLVISAMGLRQLPARRLEQPAE